ncbi:MAG: hypothetical protein JWO77_1803 [Ilumatobacteraceae bacterium]|nr:hypothetical protein [Ilumatobacteraceae bacterium]
MHTGMEWMPGERRIGARRQIRSVPMAWCRDPAKPSPFEAETRPDGNIVEVSVSGIGLIAVTHPYLAVGQTVIIASMGLTGAVVVRRIEQDRYPGESYYGVELAEPNGRLGEVLTETFLVKARHAPTEYLPKG